ncbi:MAG: FMN-binding protein [Prevotella sp.]|nr:FMN-binding protein [Prevotella sp.]
MKKIIFSLTMCMALVVLLISAKKDDGVITKENGMYVVNTSTLAADVDGYIGATPLKIYIRNNKIEKIEALPNKETPKYFAKIKKQLLDKWNGKTVKEALKAQVDGVTGATLSSDAVKENIKRGLEYYQKHK